VELATTGVPDPGRRARIRERGFPTLVVDVRGIDPCGLDEAALTGLVFELHAKKRWVFHPAVDEYVRRLGAAQKSQRGGLAPRGLKPRPGDLNAVAGVTEEDGPH
jgi:hypothetical protein